MAGLLLADVARDAVLALLKAELPAQIAAVNGARSGKHPLTGIRTWTGSPLVATPEPPAIYVLPQTSGFRGTSWAVAIDEQHALYVYVQVGNQDEETAEQDLLGYTAALVRAVLQNIRGLAPMAGGAQALFGHGGTDAEQCLVFGPSTKEYGNFYVDAYLALTIFTSEVP